MNAFSKLHPFTIFCYYVITLILLIWVGHPMLYLIMFALMFADYSLSVGGRRAVKAFLSSMCVALFCVVINPLLNHRGVTTLFLLGDTRITKESVGYGVYMAVLLLGTIFLFSCFSFVMTSEKIMTLTGRRFPSFSLLFSMILRLVPKTKKDFFEMTALHGNRPKVWSALVGKLMEDSVERSLAMKNKRYGRGKRTSFHQKKFRKQDWGILGSIGVMIVCVILFARLSPVRVQFFPSIRVEMYPALYWVMWAVYLAIPMEIKGKEELSWLLSRRKITGSIIRDR